MSNDSAWFSTSFHYTHVSSSLCVTCTEKKFKKTGSVSAPSSIRLVFVIGSGSHAMQQIRLLLPLIDQIHHVCDQSF